MSLTLVTEMDGTVKKEEEIKFGKAYDRHLMKVDKIEIEMKQVFSLVLGQADDDTRHCLEEHPDWKRVNQQKDLIKMLEILRNVNFQHTSTQEPIFTMWNSIANFVRLRQAKHQSVQEYYEHFIANEGCM